MSSIPPISSGSSPIFNDPSWLTELKDLEQTLTTDLRAYDNDPSEKNKEQLEKDAEKIHSFLENPNIKKQIENACKNNKWPSTMPDGFGYDQIYTGLLNASQMIADGDISTPSLTMLNEDLYGINYMATNRNTN